MRPLPGCPARWAYEVTKEVRENCTNNYHSPCCDFYHGAPLWAYVPASSKPVLPKQGSPSAWQQLLCSGFDKISVDAGFHHSSS